MKRKLSWILILMLVLSVGMSFADDTVTDTPTEDASDVVEETGDQPADPAEDGDVEATTDEESDDEADAPNGKGKGLTKNADKKLKNQLKLAFNDEKELVEIQKEECEAAYEALKAEYEALIEAGDEAGAAALTDELETLRAQFVQVKNELKLIIAERKVFAKQQYTTEELEIFAAAGSNIREMFQEATLLEVGSVILKNSVIKFDTPPYVKNGRTVVPVRALTEGLGADVAYDAETQQVTITDPESGLVIVLTLGSNEALVNGEPVVLDSMAEATNSRTYVPIRFVAETFGLTVDWDGENDIIEIDAAAPATQEPVTEEPVTEEPVTEEPVTEEPVTEEPVTEEPATVEPATDEATL